MPRLPLQDIRVVEIGVAQTAAFAAMLLADLGAEVIRVESTSYLPPGTRGVVARPSKEMIAGQVAFTGGYPDGEPGKRPWNRWANFNSTSRNKLSMTVDLKRPRGLEIFKRLIKVTDVLFENNAPATMEKLGAAYEDLVKIKPNIIMVRFPGFGLKGPYANWRSHGNQIDAVIGHELLRGYPDLDPTSSTSVFVTDCVCPAHGAFAAIMALHYRNQTGHGQLIEACATDTGLCLLGEALMDYSMNQRIQKTIGNQSPWGAVQGCYPCKGEDRWITISIVSDKEWKSLCRVMDDSSWSQQDMFGDSFSRWKNQDKLNVYISAWTKQHEQQALMLLLQKEGISAGAVLDQRDAYNDPHFRERKFFEKVEHEDCGIHRYPGMLWKLSETPVGIRKPPIRLGEDNEYIYKGVIGISDEEYAELEKEGHIGMDFIPEIL